MACSTQPLTLILPSDLSLLPVARDCVESFCRLAGLESAATDAIVLAVGEALSNVVRHAHRERPEAPLQIECYRSSHQVEVHILDQGEPFDLTAVPHLDPGEVRLGGRGVFLMRHLMDELGCEPRAEGGNRLRMVKRLEGPTAPP